MGFVLPDYFYSVCHPYYVSCYNCMCGEDASVSIFTGGVHVLWENRKKLILDKYMAR